MILKVINVRIVKMEKHKTLSNFITWLIQLLEQGYDITIDSESELEIIAEFPLNLKPIWNSGYSLSDLKRLII